MTNHAPTPTAAITQIMGLRQWAMLISLSIVWGGSFFFNAIAVKYLPVLTIVMLRVGLAAATLWLVIWLTGQWRAQYASHWRNLITMGLLNNVIPFSLIIYGQTQIASGLASILNATMPFFAVLVAHQFTDDEKLSAGKVAGILIALTGVAIMIGVDAMSSLATHTVAQLAVLAGAVTYGIAAVFGRRLSGLPPLITAAGQTTGSTLLLVPLALMIDGPLDLAAPGLGGWLSIIGLAIPCTALAYILYFSILKSAGAANVSLVTFLVPISAIILGITFLGEAFLIQHGFGLCAVAIGLALIDGRVLRLAR